MFGLFSNKKKINLAERCQKYLDKGPPSHMNDYVPESLTEIIIAHGAQQQELDPELREIGSIILGESQDLETIDDTEIREYMKTGADLVEAVLKS